MRGDRCLLVFSKPARAGDVKTRLIGELSAEQAAALHEAFLGDLLARLREGDFELRLAWALDGEERAPAAPVQAVRQRGADLGERMFHALSEAARSHRRVAVVGSDHPRLPLDAVQRAFEALEGGAEVVLGPAGDGGYYLVGVDGPALRRELFEDIPWSSGAVLAATLRRCREHGIEPVLLPAADDVDTPEDLERLAAELAADQGDCPRTRTLLEAWGRLPGGAVA